MVCQLYIGELDSHCCPLTPSGRGGGLVSAASYSFFNVPCALGPSSLAAPENWFRKQRGPVERPPQPPPLGLGVYSDSRAAFTVLSAV